MNYDPTPYDQLTKNEKEVVSLLHKGAESAIKLR